MTAVVFDGKSLAADKLIISHTLPFVGTKIRRAGDMLLGYSGPHSVAQEMFEWAEMGFPKESCPKGHFDAEKGGTLMVVFIDAKGAGKHSIKVYEHSATPYAIETPYHAIGSSCQVAMGAMFLKHTAEEAVQACIATSVLCGMGVDVIHIDKSKTPRRRK